MRGRGNEDSEGLAERGHARDLKRAVPRIVGDVGEHIQAKKPRSKF
jgi:hypothetical protein